MSTHSICFYKELEKTIPELSPNTHFTNPLETIEKWLKSRLDCMNVQIPPRIGLLKNVSK